MQNAEKQRATSENPEQDAGEQATRSPSLLEYHLKLTGPRGMAFEKDLDETGVKRVLSASMGAGELPLVAGVSPGPRTAPEPAGAEPEHHLPISVREFWNQHGVRTIPQKITALGAHLRASGQQGFTREDVLRGFEDAGEPTPKNLYRDLTKTVGFGWIARSRANADGFYVTAMGLQAIGDDTLGGST